MRDPFKKVGTQYGYRTCNQNLSILHKRSNHGAIPPSRNPLSRHPTIPLSRQALTGGGIYHEWLFYSVRHHRTFSSSTAIQQFIQNVFCLCLFLLHDVFTVTPKLPRIYCYAEAVAYLLLRRSCRVFTVTPKLPRIYCYGEAAGLNVDTFLLTSYGLARNNTHYQK